MPRPPSVTVRVMTPDDAPVAADLLARRQRRLRRVRTELSGDHESASAWTDAVAALLERPGAHGVIGLVDDASIGFLAGFERHEAIWGRACWSPIEGSALADGADPELIRDLYAAWSEHFVRRGFFRHYVHVAADDPDLLAAWVRTGFGVMQAHALRGLDLSAADPPPGMTIRRATLDDLGLLEPLLPLIGEALQQAPAYAITLPEGFAAYRPGWEEALVDAEAHHWVALEDGRAVACASLYEGAHGPMAPAGAWQLATAMTLPEERGRGLMRALLSAAFAEARQAGATACVTDWRTAWLPAHRSWTALGFVPTHYRLHRHVDERIAWTARTPGR
ncbi:MAG TPA: GNAT family N-acetyltransferase [candidate division Zixibacteria bacterium]|nr:GNAT family N-acetyltransferase [candidate division Zixibacteria bacterium]